jgi:hypothetical protein
MTDYPDLSQPIEASSSYPDLSQPIDAQANNGSDQSSSPIMDKIKSGLRTILPTPQMPLGLNVASGALSAFMPPTQRNLLEQAPQIMSGSNYGVPQKIASSVGETIPAMLAGGGSLPGQAMAGFGMGAMSAPSGQRLESGAENALLTTGIGKVLPMIGKTIGNLVSPATNKSMASNIQNIHDAIGSQASQGFQDVSKGVSDRGLTQVPMQQSVMDDISNAIKSKYFPKTEQANDLINRAASGDYNALRDMQSELWRKGTKAASSDSLLDNNKADEIFDLRDRINNSISNHLVNTGHDDLNALLNQSKAGYKYLQDTFYNKNIPQEMRKMVNPDIRQVPKNLGTLLQTDSIPMQNVRNAISTPPNNNWLGNNPYTHTQDIQSYNMNKGIKPLAKTLGWGGVGLGELAGLWKLYHPNHTGGGSQESSEE